MDEVAENSDELMERYLEGEEISHEEIVTALKKGVTEGHLFPVTCGVATKNLGTNRLLEALVEDVPSPAMRGARQGARRRRRTRSRSSRRRTATWSPTCSRPPPTPTPGRINMLRVYSGVLRSDSQVFNVTRRAKERIGQLAAPRGKETSTGRRARRRATSAPWRSCARPAPATCWRPRTPAISFPPLDLPAPVMAFAFEPKSKGDEEKAASAHPAPRARRTRRSTSTATPRPASRSSPGSPRSTSR